MKADNIYFDAATKKSYLIDGGLSAPANTPIDPLAFQKVNKATVEQYKIDYEHIPPECWSVRPIPVMATREMDVYSLGVLMNDVFDETDENLSALIEDCLAKDPKKRPTLEQLKNRLKDDIPPLTLKFSNLQME